MNYLWKIFIVHNLGKKYIVRNPLRLSVDFFGFALFKVSKFCDFFKLVNTQVRNKNEMSNIEQNLSRKYQGYCISRHYASKCIYPGKGIWACMCTHEWAC